MPMCEDSLVKTIWRFSQKFPVPEEEGGEVSEERARSQVWVTPVWKSPPDYSESPQNKKVLWKHILYSYQRSKIYRNVLTI